MAVEFNGLNSNQIASQRSRANEAKRTEQASKAPADTPAPQPRGENVVLSNEARALQSMEQQLRSQPDIDKEKVERIKAQIDSGTYRVDAQKLAQKMLDIEKGIFG